MTPSEQKPHEFVESPDGTDHCWHNVVLPDGNPGCGQPRFSPVHLSDDIDQHGRRIPFSAPTSAGERAVQEIISCAQATLTALNVGDVQKGSPMHMKLREVMIAHRDKARAAIIDREVGDLQAESNDKEFKLAYLRAENAQLRKVIEKLKKKLERREFYLREVGIKVPRYSKGD